MPSEAVTFYPCCKRYVLMLRWNNNSADVSGNVKTSVGCRKRKRASVLAGEYPDHPGEWNGGCPYRAEPCFDCASQGCTRDDCCGYRADGRIWGEYLKFPPGA